MNGNCDVISFSRTVYQCYSLCGQHILLLFKSVIIIVTDDDGVYSKFSF